MEKNRETNLETNSKPQGNTSAVIDAQGTNSKQKVDSNELQVKKMTPADVRGASEKNKTVEDTPAPREEQAP